MGRVTDPAADNGSCDRPAADKKHIETHLLTQFSIQYNVICLLNALKHHFNF